MVKNILGSNIGRNCWDTILSWRYD